MTSSRLASASRSELTAISSSGSSGGRGRPTSTPASRSAAFRPGTPWTGQPGPSPDCGYTYKLRSLPARTGGAGRWPITATTHWQVDWQGTSAGAPVAGQEELALSTSTALPVGELQALVTGGEQ